MKTYTINLPADAAQLVMNALAEMPFRLAAPVINHIGPQLDAQNRPNPAPAIADAVERADADLKLAAD